MVIVTPSLDHSGYALLTRDMFSVEDRLLVYLPNYNSKAPEHDVILVGWENNDTTLDSVRLQFNNGYTRLFLVGDAREVQVLAVFDKNSNSIKIDYRVAQTLDEPLVESDVSQEDYAIFLSLIRQAKTLGKKIGMSVSVDII